MPTPMRVVGLPVRSRSEFGHDRHKASGTEIGSSSREAPRHRIGRKLGDKRSGAQDVTSSVVRNGGPN